MDLFVAIVTHPITALGVAGFVVLQVHQFARWIEQQADIAWWRVPVEQAAVVYVRATGKEIHRLDPMDIDQIAAAAGCRNEVAEACLRELGRR